MSLTLGTRLHEHIGRNNSKIRFDFEEKKDTIWILFYSHLVSNLVRPVLISITSLSVVPQRELHCPMSRWRWNHRHRNRSECSRERTIEHRRERAKSINLQIYYLLWFGNKNWKTRIERARVGYFCLPDGSHVSVRKNLKSWISIHTVARNSGPLPLDPNRARGRWLKNWKGMDSAENNSVETDASQGWKLGNQSWSIVMYRCEMLLCCCGSHASRGSDHIENYNKLSLTIKYNWPASCPSRWRIRYFARSKLNFFYRLLVSFDTTSVSLA